MSYLATGEVIETEAEGQLERFINIFASVITIAEVFRNGPKALLSPLVIVSTATSLAIMKRKQS